MPVPPKRCCLRRNGDFLFSFLTVVAGLLAGKHVAHISRQNADDPGVFAAVIALITVLTIGGNQTGAEFFPVFTILSIRNIGGYIRHMEILTSIAMTFFVFIRATL